MKTSEFELMVRKIIREELKLAVGEMLTEIRKSQKQVISEKPRTVSSQPTAKTKTRVSESKRGVQLKTIAKKYTSNPALNSILAETAQSMESDFDDDEPMQLGESNVQSVRDKYRQLMGDDGSSSAVSTSGPITAEEMIGTMKFEDSEQGRPRGEIPDAVVDAVTRDYSSLMKAIIKK